ncbi:hypothetical protein [Nostoc sp.]|uniref:hypothetical protein n=1 Tax=Nostoc sp. TaxID=1180 RepID=UPI003FA5C147
MIQLKTQLTLEEFLALPEGDIISELIDGEAVPKFKNDEIRAKFFHSSITGALFIPGLTHGSWKNEPQRHRVHGGMGV